MVDFKFIFDFGSPKTYLVYKLLPGIEKRTNTTAEYVPVLLGGIFKSTNNVSPIESFKTVPAKGKYDDLDTAREYAVDNFPRNSEGDPDMYMQVEVYDNEGRIEYDNK